MSSAHSHSQSAANRTQLGYEDQSYQIVGAGRDAQVVRTIAQTTGDVTQSVRVRDTTFGLPAPAVQQMMDRILAGGQQALTQIERQNQASLAALGQAQHAVTPRTTATSRGTMAQLSHDSRVAMPWLLSGAAILVIATIIHPPTRSAS